MHILIYILSLDGTIYKQAGDIVNIKLRPRSFADSVE